VPQYDLAALWEEHCRYEFETRDVDATMATMVDAPYVNHIPTMTGGVGHDQLKRFYKYHVHVARGRWRGRGTQGERYDVGCQRKFRLPRPSTGKDRNRTYSPSQQPGPHG
jgi:hypothetical protein